MVEETQGGGLSYPLYYHMSEYIGPLVNIIIIHPFTLWTKVDKNNLPWYVASYLSMHQQANDEKYQLL